MNLKSTIRKTLPVGIAIALATVANAATTITVDSVVQRWPWNNKVDIAYHVTDGQDVANGVYYKIVFTVNVDGTSVTIDGSEVGASATTGSHKVTWIAPSGLRDGACTMTAAIYAADVPSGDDYMIVDLATGAVSYEGVFASQGDSNTRYNTDAYKTTKMVLRKVPAGSYQTGDSGYSNAEMPNSPKTWTTDRDYYIGVFPVTQDQYARIGADAGSSPSGCTTLPETYGTVAHRPVEKVSWNDLRLAETVPTAAIPTVNEAATGTFFQRLNFKTGNNFRFDLPTEVMWEIACRAGATTVYYWGDSWVAGYAVAGNWKSTVAVGSKSPNAWGLYDTIGNTEEWTLDDHTAYGFNMANRADAFTPGYNDSSTRPKVTRGGSWNVGSGEIYMRASGRRNRANTTSGNAIGFRVALIVD
jgi:formylglycine-generating enzyme required for sulfatase activity